MKINVIKIISIGDSITYGYPYTPSLSWLNMAATQLNINYVNKGINGDTTDGMVRRFERDVLRHNPSHVIIMGGTNDAYARIAIDQIINNICDMVGLAVQNDITPIIGLPIPCNDLEEEQLLRQYRKDIQQFAADNNIDIIDFHEVMVDESGVSIKEGLHCDGLHPNEVGYEVMAGVAIKTLIKTLIDARVHDYYWNEDLSCAITTLKILSEIFHCELHPQVIEAAYGLNAGRLGSQCGLVEGALMFIGVYAQQKSTDSKKNAELCHKYSSDFQEKFGNILCKELRPQGFSADNPPNLCENITKLAIAFSTAFIAKNITSDVYNIFTGV